MAEARRTMNAEPAAPVDVTMTVQAACRWIRPDGIAQDFAPGSRTAVPRNTAAVWFLLGLAVPEPELKFTPAELAAAGGVALTTYEARRRIQMRPEDYWSKAPNAAFLARLDLLTRPDGPEEAA